MSVDLTFEVARADHATMAWGIRELKDQLALNEAHSGIQLHFESRK